MRKYPAFIIDRSRRSEASRFTDDFIVCTDKEAGFIARGYILPKSRPICILKHYKVQARRLLQKRFQILRRSY